MAVSFAEFTLWSKLLPFGANTQTNQGSQNYQNSYECTRRNAHNFTSAQMFYVFTKHWRHWGCNREERRGPMSWRHGCRMWLCVVSLHMWTRCRSSLWTRARLCWAYLLGRGWLCGSYLWARDGLCGACLQVRNNLSGACLWARLSKRHRSCLRTRNRVCSPWARSQLYCACLWVRGKLAWACLW